MTQQVITLQPGEKYQVNACISGYILNPNATSASFTVTNPVGNVIKTLLPYRSWNFSSLEFDYLINTGTNAIELDISPGTGTNVSESINTLFGVVNVSGNVNVSGSVSIIGVVSISGNVNITNTTLNISGSVNILGYVSITGTVNISGNVSIIGSVTVSGSVSITNTTLNISGSVNILGYVSITGTVNISGTVAITGTVNVTGNINITNSTVNISGGVNIYQSISLPTDIGGYSTNLQENQTSNTNTLTYNPWGYSTGTNPAPFVGTIGSNGLNANVQQNGASGYLTFFFNVYNPTSASGSANITVYLYDHLPEGGSQSTPINKFTFSSGTLAAGAQAWVTVTPNIFWAYNSLVAVPQEQVGTTNTTIGVTVSEVFNSNTHFWGGTIWQNGNGFIGFWSITNTAPASLPVAVANPVRVSEGNAAQATSSTSSLAFTLATVPNGKKWKILMAYMLGSTGASSPTVQMWLGIQRKGITASEEGPQEFLIYLNVSSPAVNTVYTAYANTVSLSTPLPTVINATTWQDYPILYAGDQLVADNNMASENYTAVYYVESDI